MMILMAIIRSFYDRFWSLLRVQSSTWICGAAFFVAYTYYYWMFLAFLYSTLGIRLLKRNIFTDRPRIRVVKLRTIEDENVCWGTRFISPSQLHICSRVNNITELSYLDKTTHAKFPFSEGNAWRGCIWKIANIAPCIQPGCPNVSMAGNYIGIPTTDLRTGDIHYYIFLLPGLTLLKHGVVTGNSSIYVLWNDVLDDFWWPLLEKCGFLTLLITIGILKCLNLRLWCTCNGEGTVYGINELIVRAAFGTGEELGKEKEQICPSSPSGSIATSENHCEGNPLYNEFYCVHKNGVFYKDLCCQDLRRKVVFDLHDHHPMKLDGIVLPFLRRLEENSDCESLVSVHQEENRSSGPSKLVYLKSGGWCDAGSSGTRSSETSDSDEDCDMSSDSSFSAVEDTHSPPVRVVSFSSEGVVFEDYSEQTRQDPVGGE